MTESYSYTIQLQTGTKSLNAFLARPLAEGSYPAIVVGHEWAGLVDHPKTVAIRLAREGYVTLVIDLFGGKRGRTMDECKVLSESLSDSEAIAGYRSGLEFLKTVNGAPQKRLGALGFCMSGRHMYLLASQATELSAVAVFYGRPQNARISEKQPVHPIDVLPQIRCPFLGIYGEADVSIPAEQVAAVREVLRKQGKIFEIYTYPGAQHAFGNDTNPERYHPQASADAWSKMIAFFNKHLKS
jgi:carboxymethylenebutenolidase